MLKIAVFPIAALALMGFNTPPDKDYDALRNRVGEPQVYHKVHVSDIVSLPTFFQVTPRSSWWASETIAVAKWESQGVVVNGYVVNKQYLDKESCNPPNTYTLMFNLAEKRGDDSIPSSIVCHITPAMQKTHPTWTPKGMAVLNRNYVKVYGWLLWESYASVDFGTQITCWEISPVTKIEYDDNGVWKEL